MVAVHAAADVEEEPTFSAPDLARLTDLSYRQIDYWCRIGLLRPFREANGSGSARRFDERELRVAVVCGVLSELGAPLSGVVVRVAERLRERGVPDRGSLFVRSDGTIGEPGAGWMVDLDELGFARETVDA